MVNIKVDSEKCTGCMACVEVCPEFFFQKKSQAEIVAVEVPPELVDKCHFAAGICPTAAIELFSQDPFKTLQHILSQA